MGLINRPNNISIVKFYGALFGNQVQLQLHSPTLFAAAYDCIDVFSCNCMLSLQYGRTTLAQCWSWATGTKFPWQLGKSWHQCSHCCIYIYDFVIVFYRAAVNKWMVKVVLCEILIELLRALSILLHSQVPTGTWSVIKLFSIYCASCCLLPLHCCSWNFY